MSVKNFSRAFQILKTILVFVATTPPIYRNIYILLTTKIVLGDNMTDEYVPRHIKIKKEHVDKLKEIKQKSGRSQQWVIAAALDYFFEHEWDRLIQ